MTASDPGTTPDEDTGKAVGANSDVSHTPKRNNSDTTTKPTPCPRKCVRFAKEPSEVLRKQQQKRNERFMEAVRHTERSQASELFQEGVDIDFVDEEGFTALHWAAGFRNPRDMHNLTGRCGSQE